MSRFGEQIDVIDNSHLEVYNDFIDYFGNPIMTKISSMNNNSIYAVRRSINNDNGNKYILVNTKEDGHSIGFTKPLSDIQWDSFQTRVLKKDYDVLNHTYETRKFSKFETSIHRIEKQENSSTYICNGIPVKVILIDSKKQYFNYKDKGTLLSAIETYNTILIHNNT
jgi:hypothetical protein